MIFGMKLNKYLIACACAFTAGAHAENNWYVLGSIGQSNFDAKKSDVDNELLNAGFLLDSSSFDKADTGYKLQFGYEFNSNFALEGGHVDLGELTYKASSFGVIPADLKAKIEVNGWNIDAVGILPINNGFSLFAKVGFIDAKVEAKTTASSPFFTTSSKENSSDIKPLFGLGAAYKLNAQVSMRIEIERYHDLGDNDTGGEGDVDLYSAGIAYKF